MCKCGYIYPQPASNIYSEGTRRTPELEFIEAFSVYEYVEVKYHTLRRCYILDSKILLNRQTKCDIAQILWGPDKINFEGKNIIKNIK